MGELNWGTPLFFDLWAAGMAGGAYFAAFLINLFGTDEDQGLLKLATYVAVPLALLGVLALVVDLGEPLRFWHLLVGLSPWDWQVVSGSGAAAVRAWPPYLTFYPLSPMSLGTWILVVFSVTGVALIVLWFAEAAKSEEPRGGILGWVAEVLRSLVPLIGVLRWIGFVFAILVMTYTGVVLAVSSRALWATTYLVPTLFVTSAIATGVAALIAAVKLTRGQEPSLAMARLSRALAVLIVMQMLVLAALLVWLGLAGEIGALISGTLGLVFWVGVVVLGLLVPLALQLALTRTAEAPSAAMLVSPVLVLLGGLVLRAVVVIGGQI